jgi:hypothetical protein
MSSDFGNKHSYKQQFSPKTVETALMKDNPSVSHLREINAYIKNLDSRLSVPKFESPCGSKQKIYPANYPYARENPGSPIMK